MKKLLTFFKTYLQNNLYYRSAAIVWVIVDTAPIVVLILLWKAIYQTNNLVAGLNFNQMVSYYLLITFVYQLVYTAGGRNTVTDEIYTGSLSFFLLKPYNYLKRIFIEEISWRVFQTSLFLPLFFILTLVLSKTISLSFNFSLWPVFSISIIFSFFISGFLDYICGLAGFWLIQTVTLFHLKDVFYWVLGGLAFPQDLFPPLVQKLNLGLPFYYVFAFPIEIITKQFTGFQLLQRFFIQISWFIILFLIYKFLWKKGTKRYEAWGN